MREIACALSPAFYARTLGFPGYGWQDDYLDSDSKRRIVNGSRQSGKSTSVVALPCHGAKYHPGSLHIIGAAVEKQAYEDIEKAKDFIGRDPSLKIERTSDELIQVSYNGLPSSRIMVVTATEKSFRGYSQPMTLTLDEASRIADVVYGSGVRPMLTQNPRCVLTMLSTPNGRSGFFARAWASKDKRWEKFLIRAPWDVIDETWDLVPAMPFEEFRLSNLFRGIRAYYSTRHEDHTEQLDNLKEMGPRMYRQEYLTEFVEAEGQIFRYADIEFLKNSEALGLPPSGFDVSDLEALQIPEGLL